jgi:hypothetical protein
MADVVFGENGGGAAFGNPSITRQGRAGGATQVASTSTTAPPNASAAPKPSTPTVGTGLVAALNNFQLNLLKGGQIEIADIYEIQFPDVRFGKIISDASIVPPGGLDKALAVGAAGGSAADKLLPNKQSMDPKSRARAASAGQQIVQFIDQVIRSSSYIQDQSGEIWNQSIGKWEKHTARAQQFAWFQVLCNVDILGYDYKRKDHAYRMVFTVVPFETPMLSTYFPSGKYRGVHKAYRYWFTGENSAVLNFEQSFNNQWTQAITGTTTPDIRVQKANFQTNPNYQETWKTNVFPASSQSNQGGDKYTNEPGANAADFLYTADLATAKITIVGDPAWLPSPLTDYVSPEMFTTSPFLADGTINSVASGAYFQITFNTPADYNLQTGLIDPSTAPTGPGNTNTVSTVYVASKATHIFKGGKFTQELEGAWVTYDASVQKTAPTTRETKAPVNTASRVERQRQQQQETQRRAVESQQTNLGKGVQQILNPVDVPPTASDAELRGSPAYIEARKAGKTDTQALVIARSASAAGTNNNQGTALPGIRTGPQPIVKDGNPG